MADAELTTAGDAVALDPAVVASVTAHLHSDTNLTVTATPCDLAVSDDYAAAVAAGTAPPPPTVVYRIEPRG